LGYRHSIEERRIQGADRRGAENAEVTGRRGRFFTPSRSLRYSAAAEPREMGELRGKGTAFPHCRRHSRGKWARSRGKAEHFLTAGGRAARIRAGSV
jgi:hypothetical protein